MIAVGGLRNHDRGVQPGALGVIDPIVIDGR